ncbi:redox-sensing transcriptional repressor Rex [Gordonia insulae]|uniref:Redox-sensing transcriptional repressor Rex n=1 Tax=Gordonia insulae TaxID=2420509 RepID=A0A3G8JTD9_9ACTN|nr:redox-sensing transcriptional repressor Rex [Gordonia insulae]AZG47985.1 Redox-sensing transcriptional repressor Rex [Gordonia insulae]
MSGSASASDSNPSQPADDDTAQPPPAEHDIPEPAVTRLATYLHVLRSFSERGVLIASSVQLATAAGVNSAILRKDLSHVGANGVRGVGYDVGRLTARISLALHTDSVHTVALAGAGRLGQALLAHAGHGRGFRVAAMFDADPAVVGTILEPGGPTVAPLTAIADVCAGRDVEPIEIGVVATADADAQAACDAFVGVGVRQLLNVTQMTLRTDSDVAVRQVDLALELQVLAFNASRSRAGSASAGRATGTRGLNSKSAMGATGLDRMGSATGEETVTA